MYLELRKAKVQERDSILDLSNLYPTPSTSSNHFFHFQMLNDLGASQLGPQTKHCGGHARKSMVRDTDLGWIGNKVTHVG